MSEDPGHPIGKCQESSKLELDFTTRRQFFSAFVVIFLSEKDEFHFATKFFMKSIIRICQDLSVTTYKSVETLQSIFWYRISNIYRSIGFHYFIKLRSIDFTRTSIQSDVRGSYPTIHDERDYEVHIYENSIRSY